MKPKKTWIRLKDLIFDSYTIVRYLWISFSLSNFLEKIAQHNPDTFSFHFKFFFWSLIWVLFFNNVIVIVLKIFRKYILINKVHFWNEHYHTVYTGSSVRFQIETEWELKFQNISLPFQRPGERFSQVTKLSFYRV